jgi:endonuclease/exonuclease/phosphatase family metal-dependent hydrolase
MDGDAAVVRAATWNLWWLFGEDWHRRERGIVATLEEWGPDVVGLQECWALGDRTQADALAEELGLYAAFVEPGLPPPPRPIEHPDQIGVRIGLGLLSRWPVTSVVAQPVPSASRELVALVARIDHPLGVLNVIVGASSWEPERRAERARQLAALGDLAVDRQRDGRLPVLLLADLNTDFSTPDLAALGTRLSDTWGIANAGRPADPRTFSAQNRFADPAAALQYNRRIDHVLARAGDPEHPVRVAGSWIVRSEFDGMPPSDHYLVVTDLSV